MRAPLLILAALSMLCCSTGLAAQDRDSAEVFLRSIYQRYDIHGRGVAFSGRYYHSTLLALIRADQKAAGGEIPICCDSDPVCNCQDWDGIWDLRIKIQNETPERAEAQVFFALSAPKNRRPGEERNLGFTLLLEHGRWRIYNIHDESDPSHPSDFRKNIQRDIAEFRKAK